MTWLLNDPVFLQHDTGPGHPERSDRLRVVAKRLQSSGLAAKCTGLPWVAAKATDIARVHPGAYLQQIEEICSKGGGYLDPDTPVCPKSNEIALFASGAILAAVNAVLRENSPPNERTAFCLVRPPGHHSTPTKPMGFCLYNHIAVAARYAQAIHGLNRILIVDWDVHHGNGTQDTFYEDSSVHFLSIHRYGGGFYPGTGQLVETGTGDGLGTTQNVPLNQGTTRKGYKAAFRQALEQAAKHKPELVLLSAGFDACRADPVGDLGLEPEDYVELTKDLKDLANAHCGGRLVSMLEGGYHLEQLAESVNHHLQGLLRE